MSEPGPRVAEWFGIVSDLLRQPIAAMPTRFIVSRLVDTFDVTAASWNWRDHDQSFGMILQPSDALDALSEDLERWAAGELHDCHALLNWYARTKDPRPWSNDRVPSAILRRSKRARVEEPLKSVGLNQQMSINYRLDGVMHRAFVLARGGRDFSDDDLVVARSIQRAMMALDVQTQLVARLSGGAGVSTPAPALAATDLTGRELAVLQLLAEGHSTRLIGRQLMCSPRTVEKHLERSYRKLGVRDRVNAVRLARAWGLAPSVNTLPSSQASRRETSSAVPPARRSKPHAALTKR